MQRQTLSDAEMEIMTVLWDNAEALSVGEITALFSETKGWKVQTVSTFISRLLSKGYLNCEKRRNAGYYSPAITRAEYDTMLAKSLLDETYQGSLKRLCASLVDSGSVSEEELSALKAWFDERYQK